MSSRVAQKSYGNEKRYAHFFESSLRHSQFYRFENTLRGGLIR